MDDTELQSILQTLGERVPPASRLVLMGGSALALLGSPRPTIDIDFIGDDVHPSILHQTLLQIAKELGIHLEPVPIERFIPVPAGSEERNIRIGQFANLEIFVADPYSIALSKLDRGLDTDLDDIVFLIQHQHMSLAEMERITRTAMTQSASFDLHPDTLARLEELKRRLK